MSDVASLLAKKQAELRELQEDIQALERVNRMFPNGGHDSDAVANTIHINLSELRAKRTHKEAVDYIADLNGGRVKAIVAKDALIRAGLVKGKHQYVYGHIYSMLKNDDRYEAIGNAEFQKSVPREASHNPDFDLKGLDPEDLPF